MGLRWLRLSSHYPAYLAQFYAARPGLFAQPYTAQHAALMVDGFGWADFWSVALGRLGYDTCEVIANAEPLQKRWAAENGITFTENGWTEEIALAQIEAFAPDVLFFTTWSSPFDAAFIERCRAACPSIRLVLGWCGEAHPAASFFRAHDLILTCAPDTLAYLRAHGNAAEHLNHAFDVRLLEFLPESAPPTVDVGFIGQITFGDQYHNRRAEVFYAVAQDIDLALYGAVSSVSTGEMSVKGRTRAIYYRVVRAISRAGLDGIAQRLPRYAAAMRLHQHAVYAPVFEALRARARPAVFGRDMVQTLSGFKICLNAHGPSAYASNMRLYEATGVGTCLLTDWKDNLPELFEPDVEVATYRSTEECVEKARYLLDHDRERQAIAAAGQRRTLRDHTFTQRAAQLDHLIRDALQ